MRIAIMGRALQYEGYGLSTLLDGLLRGIAQHNTKHDIIIFIDPQQSTGWMKEHYQVIPITPTTELNWQKVYWDHISVGKACNRLKVDVLYAPAHLRPFSVPCPVVVSVLDMMYHRFPKNWLISERFYYQIGFSLLTTRANAIAALSESTKRDILHFYPKLVRKPIEVIYPGVPEGFHELPSKEGQFLLEKYHLQRPYILYVGGFQTRKNLIGMLETYLGIMSEIEQDLVLLGPRGWENKDILRSITEPTERIHYLGLVPRTELPHFFNEAEIFIFPSFYEGFGFPVLEAMACGCPTITSKTSSLPEVGGDSVLYIPPGDKNALKTAILHLINDSNAREHLRESGLQQAMKFSWSKMAEKTITLLESV